MHDIKAIFFDIDGTLVPVGQKIFSPATLQALKRLQEQGILLYIATGRTLTTFRFAYEQFPFDGYLAMNGQYCVHKEKVLRENVLDKDQIAALLPYIEARDITVAFVEKDALYINSWGHTYHEYQIHYPRHDPVEDLSRISDHDIYQMIIYMTTEEEQNFIVHFPYFQPVRWSPYFADVIAYDGGKEAGIDAFCTHLGITREQVMAFGDGGNDIGMLRHAGIGVAMGNAADHVKAAADYVTGDVADEGLVQALKHFQLI